jgi:thiosulfate/3-mercaptopyruvate sulfurtransferase
MFVLNHERLCHVYQHEVIMRILVFIITVFMAIPLQAAESWLLSADRAVALLANATVLDTRGGATFGLSHVDGSTRVTWKEFSKTKSSERGELLSDQALKKAIERIGVRNDRSVIVVGDPDAWGEDGRVVWMLRAVGHEAAFMVDGGYPALKKAGAATSAGFSHKQSEGDFTIRWKPELNATSKDVKTAMTSDAVILDVREKREYDGKTPYGESRGGHVPGAKHLWFKDLLQKDGTLRSRGDIEKEMAARGVTREVPVIAYCTGGIRSGWMVAVLVSMGYQVSNYAGSMWQWSSLPERDFPLE